jgi:hypothetical protein
MPIGSDFRVSRVVILESLEPHETKTGAVTAEFVRALDSVSSLRLAVEYRTCENVAAFADQVRALAADATTSGSVPLLHVECHGGADVGLEFANGSVLSWSDLSNLLVDLNRATRFNLVAVFAACYGAHFLSRMSNIDPAPFYAMVAPTEGVLPSELLAGFRKFYSIMFSGMDAGVAVAAMIRTDLHVGQWFAEQAELWYERVAVGYIKAHCTRAEMKVRALRMHRKLRELGQDAAIGSVKRDLQRLNRENLLGKFFDRYFMTDAIPENMQRFHSVRRHMEARIVQLQKTGHYGI